MQTAIDKFDKNEFIKNKITSSTTEGFIVEGEIFHVCPYNLRMYLELDTPAGICGKIFLGFMAQLGKWGLVRHKVEEWMEASPANPGSYQATIQQKQQIEAQIKSGLAGISSAVSDFELLFHDLRKYRDFMQHFEKIEKGKRDKKPELVAEGTQTLKAVFIDQVDVHTGEGIAMKMIAPRWPTIIADFMKLTEKDIDQKKISERYQVSEAEGVVLATKNKLFLEWFNTFKATVLDRYERIKGLMEARKKSIEEYKNILKPYITRYRYLRELGESPEGRRLLEGLGWLRPQGQLLINTMEFQTVWVWKPFFPPDLYKSAAEPLVVKKNIFRMPFPREFKNWIREEFKTNKKLREKYSEVETSQTGIEPLDIYVM
ncbi:MAG TPA: hypothetical protein VJ343_00385, partial [archaeon]|nr:hypothetical protein [archaeon]